MAIANKINWNNIMKDIEIISSKKASLLTKDDLNKLTVHLNSVIGYFENIRNFIKQKEALKRLKKSAKSKGYEGALEGFLNSPSNKSKTITDIESLNRAEEAVQQLESLREDNTVKIQLIQAKQMIMAIRSIVIKSKISYNLFLVGTNKIGQKMILMGENNLDQLISSSGKLSSNLDVSLSYTTAEINNIIEGYTTQESIMSQWKNILTSERQPAWEILEEVRAKIKSRKDIYLNYGELVEALINLDNQQINAQTLFQAIKDGLNTTSFEQKGDIQMDGEDIQAKTMAGYGKADSPHIIRYVSVSNIMRVLTNIRNVLLSSNEKNIEQNLKQLFNMNNTTSKLSASSEPILQEIIKEVLEDCKNRLNLS